MGGGWYVQELTAGNANALYKYIRQFNGSTWSDWIRMKYTDTTYSVATTTTNGLMSSEDKIKLDSLEDIIGDINAILDNINGEAPININEPTTIAEIENINDEEVE